MIISREYVTFRQLLNFGDEAGKFFVEMLHESYPENLWDSAFDSLADLCLYQRNMDWAFYKIGDVIDKFAELDENAPFDNGCSYEDINDFEIEFQDEHYIKYHLISNHNGNKIIVKVVEMNE